LFSIRNQYLQRHSQVAGKVSDRLRLLTALHWVIEAANEISQNKTKDWLGIVNAIFIFST